MLWTAKKEGQKRKRAKESARMRFEVLRQHAARGTSIQDATPTRDSACAFRRALTVQHGGGTFLWRDSRVSFYERSSTQEGFLASARCNAGPWPPPPSWSAIKVTPRQLAPHHTYNLPAAGCTPLVRQFLSSSPPHSHSQPHAAVLDLSSFCVRQRTPIWRSKTAATGARGCLTAALARVAA